MEHVPTSGPSTASVHIVRGPETFVRMLARLGQTRIMGLHVHATGPDPLHDAVRLLLIATDELVFVVDTSKVLDLTGLVPLIQDPGRLKVFHNGKRTLRYLAQLFGYEEPLGTLSPSVFDTFIASQLLGLPQGEGGLRSLAVHHFPQAASLSSDDSASGIESESESSVRSLGATAGFLLPLRQVLRGQLIENDLVHVAKIEFDLVPVMADMEQTGIYLNQGAWNQVWAPYYVQREKLTEELGSTLGATMQQSLFGSAVFNPDSQQQTLEALRRLGLDLPHTGESLLRQHADTYPQVRTLLEYRTVAKLISSCGDLFPQYIHSATGRIHASYHQLGARTGRMSCSDPNIQQVPRIKEVRSCFQAQPGNVLVTADYSQVELRVAAALSGDRRMLQAYRDRQDLHRLTASLIQGIRTQDVSDQDRQAAKAVNFGLLYAMGAAGLAKYAQSQYGVTLSLSQAEAFRHRFFNAYTGIRRWHDEAKRLLNTAKEQVVEVRSVAGRRYRFHGEGRLAAFLNAPVQGSAADIMKRAMVRVHHALTPLRGRIIGVVHDELLVEVPEETSAQAAAVVRTEMEAAGSEFFDQVPFEAEARVVPGWE